MEYRPSDIEAKWQKKWESTQLFAHRGTGKKYYMLEMFPYPSGRLHMGHVRNYSIGDVVARYFKRTGHDVLHPIGWDAFGLPAENAAIEHSTAPAAWTAENINRMRSQFKSLGLSYDWNREIATCNASYYRWEQTFFLDMLKQGLAYRKESEVNWCPQCNTVLANEQVENGQCWRHGCPVEKKEMQQWYFKTTKYADELLANLDELPDWPETVKEMQRNWIGRSEGTYIDFGVQNSDRTLRAFTTRPDTLMGVTFASIAVEHPFIKEILQQTDNPEEMRTFISEVKQLHGSGHMDTDEYEKKGMFTGMYLTHPITGNAVPLYLANFVLASYGTGMVMAVPAHDQRDFEFAKKYNIPVKQVIRPVKGSLPDSMKEAFTEDGVMIHSGQFDGLSSHEGKKAVTNTLIERKMGERGIQYRLRDWGISRQRYWGNPIPVVYCNSCGTVPVPENDLPVVLPEDVEFSGAESPLLNRPDFYRTTCPVCGGEARRETDTMDTFVQSSWYHMKYISPQTESRPFISDDVNRTMPVDQYIGGIEHATGHLMYTRFFTMVLNDLGYIDFREPIKALLTQGMVCMGTYSVNGSFVYPEQVEHRPDGPVLRETGERVTVGRVEKMSKSKKNVVSPMEIIKQYGADTARLFVLFASPPRRDLEWSEAGIEGSHRFLRRVWSLVEKTKPLISQYTEAPDMPKKGPARDLFRKTHDTVRRVRSNIESFAFNTAISALMELVNQCYKTGTETDEERQVTAFAVRTIVSLLNPFAPHITEEMHTLIGASKFLSDSPFPDYEESALKKDEITLVVQVNGKLRDRIIVPPDISREAVEKIIGERDYSEYLRSGNVKKVIYIPGRLINVVG